MDLASRLTGKAKKEKGKKEKERGKGNIALMLSVCPIFGNIKDNISQKRRLGPFRLQNVIHVFLRSQLWISVMQYDFCLGASSAQKKKKSPVVVHPLDPDGLNVEVGDQVLVAGQKHGIVRFYGKTDFAPGLSSGMIFYSSAEAHLNQKL